MQNFKKILYNLSYDSGFSNLLVSHKQHIHKLIITYHNVLPSSELSRFFTNNVDVSAEIFEFQIRSLLEKFGIQPGIEIIDPDKKGIYLSFDDGMLNNIEIIAPILKKYGITAMFAICNGLVQENIEFIWRDTIFLMLKCLMNKKLIVSDMPSLSGEVINEKFLNRTAAALTAHIEKNNKMDHVYEYLDEILLSNDLTLNRDSFSQLRYSPMSLADIKYLRSEGHFIVSHTNTHRKLFLLSDPELEKELTISRNYFIKELGQCNTLVYPYGTSAEVNERVMHLVDKAGYKYAFLNTEKGFENSDLFMSRVSMGNVFSKPAFFGILAGMNKLGIRNIYNAFIDNFKDSKDRKYI